MLQPTWSIPGSDFNKHAEKQLSFGDTKGFFLILLLSEEYQPIAVFWCSMDLNWSHFPMFLEFMEKSIFQTRVCIGKQNYYNTTKNNRIPNDLKKKWLPL